MAGSNLALSSALRQIDDWVEAVADWFRKDPEAKELYENLGATPDVYRLPAEYDNVPFTSVVNGQWVKTVREAKAASETWRQWNGGE